MLLVQPCSITCLVCWLSYSPWKDIFTHREYFGQVIFSALFLQPAEAGSVVRSFVETKPSWRRNFLATSYIHLGSRVDTHCAWTTGNTWSPAALAAATFAAHFASHGAAPSSEQAMPEAGQQTLTGLTRHFPFPQNNPSASEDKSRDRGRKVSPISL